MARARSKDKEHQPTGKDRVTLTDDELRALREIVIEWLGEQLSIQPFVPEAEGLIEKLDIPQDVLAANRERVLPLPNMV